MANSNNDNTKNNNIEADEAAAKEANRKKLIEFWDREVIKWDYPRNETIRRVDPTELGSNHENITEPTKIEKLDNPTEDNTNYKSEMSRNFENNNIRCIRWVLSGSSKWEDVKQVPSHTKSSQVSCFSSLTSRTYKPIKSHGFIRVSIQSSLYSQSLYVLSLISLLEVVLVLVPTLLSVAFTTVAERKTMASMQRRLGPNIIGYYGLLQAFADALKLLLKEYISPTQANKFLFFLGPVVTLIFSLLGFAVIPYAPGIMISDFNLGILYMLAMSSLSTYGILLAGWSANSKYAFLGSLRSTAQLISYELILSSAILLVILFSGSLSLTVNIEAQKAVWYVLPLLPVFIIFFIGSVAETNRAPFDLVEAESELVSGYMTEHAAVVFVFFFLAEYASILLICILASMLFLGGYLYSSTLYTNIISYMSYPLIYLSENVETDILTPLSHNIDWHEHIVYKDISNIIYFFKTTLLCDNPEYIITDLLNQSFSGNPLFEGLKYSMILGLKACVLIFIFIWTRASYPRIRYDQLMSYCWTILLPLIIAIIILFPCVLYSFKILPNNTFLF